MSIQRETVYFDSLLAAEKGNKIAAWHFLPSNNALSNAKGAPAVIMGHGLALTRDCGLQIYAEQFAAAGMHVIAFDYRCFGESEGQPREMISVKMQVEDYHAALAYARQLPGVDSTRIGVWGTSYSGGIATQCAYEDGNVQALVIQVPNLDNLATGVFMTKHLTLTAPVRGLKIVWDGARDTIASLFGLNPVYIKAQGRIGSGAAYENDESMDQFDQIRGPMWQNRLLARDFVTIPFRPIKHIKDIKCNIQIFAADNDDLTPAGPAYKAAEIAGSRAELHSYPMGHFGIYVGDVLKDALQKQTRFFSEQLK